ncbi:prepilin-type N-terminal cleavage/methylation domain-containing protein [Candidatus Halobeggiatoa sp. HSG11]|nr:prepilin-type N-terminal cleavage/methylation domain-containing protein [Candidatus Halobeggiatoa sp. HSG11]
MALSNIIKKNFNIGFTLLEMLVVLVLVSFITVLLLEGFSYVLHLRSSFLNQFENLQRGALQEYWFRSTTAGIIVDYKDGKNVFKGKERQFSGLTLAALDQNIGVPTPFIWKMEYADGMTILRYKNKKTWDVSHWLGKNGKFRYLDKDGKWHNKWPPKIGLDIPQIPKVIQFQGQRRNQAITWIVKLSDKDEDKQ